MIDVQTQTRFSVVSSVSDSAVLDLARDFLAGQTEDYFLFQFSESEFVLLIGSGFQYDAELSQLTTGNQFTIIDIYRLSTEALVNDSDYFSGRNLTIDLTESGFFDGEIKHSGTISVFSYITKVMPVEVDEPITIQAGTLLDSVEYSFICYGSAPELPHLIEGVENYAFFTAVLLCCFVAYSVFASVFRHVTN